MKLRYVFLIAVLSFIAGGAVVSICLALPLFMQLMIAREELQDTQAMLQANPVVEEKLDLDGLKGLDIGGDDDREVLVPVTTQKFTQWSTIREPKAMFDVERMPRRRLPVNAIVLDTPEKLETLKGRRFRATVDEGTILTEDHLLKKEVTGIDAMLEKGKRAMSIPISADKAVGFFVVPGSKVDVVHSHQGKTNVLLKNVLVLAVDLRTDARREDPKGLATATLQMDNEEQVLKLAGAMNKGTLSLVMRPPADDDDDAPKPTPKDQKK